MPEELHLIIQTSILNHFLEPIEEIHITMFDSKDVVRHHLVQKTVEAFDIEEEQERLAKKRARNKEIRKTS